jgi:hypothetical protein
MFQQHVRNVDAFRDPSDTSFCGPFSPNSRAKASCSCHFEENSIPHILDPVSFAEGNHERAFQFAEAQPQPKHGCYRSDLFNQCLAHQIDFKRIHQSALR